MNPMDVAEAYARLLSLAGYDFRPGRKMQGVNQGIRKIAKETGDLNEDTVAQYLALLGETREVQNKLRQGLIPRTVFREIDKAPEEIREELKKDVLAKR